jgi:hypothetical protein
MLYIFFLPLVLILGFGFAIIFIGTLMRCLDKIDRRRRVRNMNKQHNIK